MITLKTENLIDSKILAISALFSFFLIFFEILSFNISYPFFIFHYSTRGNFTFTTVCNLSLLLSLLLFFFFTYITFSSSWRFKIIYFLVFAFAVSFEYGYQKAFKRFSGMQDLYTASVSTFDQKLTSTTEYFSFIALIPIFAYLTMLFVVKRKSDLFGLKSFLLIMVLFAGFYICVWLATPKFFLVETFPTISVGNFSRTGVSYLQSRYFDYLSRRENVENAFPSSYVPPNNIVFVLDESVRGDHLSLNGYSRETTPYLKELFQQKLLFNWGITVSGATCSVQSHNTTIVGLKPDDIPYINDRMKRFPTIFQYAKASNYKTYYLDGQKDIFWGGIPNDLKDIDVWLKVNEFHNENSAIWEIDFNMAKRINKIITSSTGNFIFVYKRGNHNPYNLNYPQNATQWMPTENSYYALPEKQSELVNSYDNGLRFNLDTFFKFLVSDYKNIPNNTTIIYTSDHGDTLGEGGLNNPHCGDNLVEANVPLFMLGNRETTPDTNFKASHANIFATILDLMNYPESLRKYDYALSLLKAKASDSKERFYLKNNFSERIKFD